MSSNNEDAIRYAGFAPDALTYRDAPLSEDEIPPPSPDTAVWVTTSFRMRPEQHARVKALAAAQGVDMSTLLRGWIDLQIAAASTDAPISLQDALRALAGLPTLRRPV